MGGLAADTVAGRLSRRFGTARMIWLSMIVPGPLYLLIPRRALASQAGIRPALLVSTLGMWGAGLFVVCSPLRGMRELPEPAATPVGAPPVR